MILREFRSVLHVASVPALQGYW